MVGGLDTCGSANACAMRSVTIWRARTRSVPGSKVIRIEERPGTDLEWMVLSHGTPLSKSCSIGTVINCSTSSAERPRASVWTSTYGGVNSGKTSVDMAGSWMMPTTSSPAASTTTKSRDFRLAATILRIGGLSFHFFDGTGVPRCSIGGYSRLLGLTMPEPQLPHQPRASPALLQRNRSVKRTSVWLSASRMWLSLLHNYAKVSDRRCWHYSK